MTIGTEQLPARQYAVRRAVAALTSGDTLPLASPGGWCGRAAVAGVVITALGAAIAAAYGLFFPA